MPKKPKGHTLSARIDLRKLAEYHAAVEILERHSVTVDLLDHAKERVEEAKARTTSSAFEELVEQKIRDIQEYGAKKARERKRSQKGNAQPGAKPAARKQKPA